MINAISVTATGRALPTLSGDNKLPLLAGSIAGLRPFLYRRRWASAALANDDKKGDKDRPGGRDLGGGPSASRRQGRIWARASTTLLVERRAALANRQWAKGDHSA
ncbi:unnamed protein product, partial [Iphiclides podalirius]